MSAPVAQTPAELDGLTVLVDVRTTLVDALSQIPGLRAYRSPGGNLEPPAALVSAPRLAWSLRGPEPTEGTYAVVLVVPADDRAMDRLDALIPQVAAALDGTRIAVVTTGEPGTFDAGGTPLPCYFIEIEVAL